MYTCIYKQLNDDAGFQEFLEVHQNVGVKPVWTNDSVKTKNSGKGKAVDSNDNDGDESSSSEDDDENESERKDSGKDDYVCYKL